MQDPDLRIELLARASCKGSSEDRHKIRRNGCDRLISSELRHCLRLCMLNYFYRYSVRSLRSSTTAESESIDTCVALLGAYLLPHICPLSCFHPLPPHWPGTLAELSLPFLLSAHCPPLKNTLRCTPTLLLSRPCSFGLTQRCATFYSDDHSYHHALQFLQRLQFRKVVNIDN